MVWRGAVRIGMVMRRVEMRNEVVWRGVEMGGERRCFVERGGEDRDGDEER